MDGYFCDNQMTFEECLQEMELYKWRTGQYMNLPIEEEEPKGGVNDGEKDTCGN